MERLVLIHRDRQQDEIHIAITEDGLLVSYIREKLEKPLAVGDIFLGRIRRVSGGLNVAFVDLGFERDGFLHYSDLTPNIRTIVRFFSELLAGKKLSPFLEDFKIEPQTKATGNITEVLKEDIFLPVQVKKEPVESKGPRVSCEYALAGRYLVLHPFQDVKGISRKIKDRRIRARLRRFIERNSHPLFGIIARTAAQYATEREFVEEFQQLRSIWQSIVNRVRALSEQYRRGRLVPQRIYREPNRLHTILRDLLPDQVTRIVIDDRETYEEVREYLKQEVPNLVDKLRLHQPSTPLFDFYKVQEQIQLAYSRVVPLPEGAYLVIDRTEAFHVIDVNSGSYVPREGSQELTALKINLLACKEIARQIRLRDLGGLILIDFIDMKKRESRNEVYQTFQKYMQVDKAKHVILPLTRFNILQMTRERTYVPPSIKVDCPWCDGTGSAPSASVLLRTIERYLLEWRKAYPRKWVCTVRVSPEIYSLYKVGFPSRALRLSLRLRCWLRFRPVPELRPMEFQLIPSLPVETRKRQQAITSIGENYQVLKPTKSRTRATSSSPLLQRRILSRQQQQQQQARSSVGGSSSSSVRSRRASSRGASSSSSSSSSRKG